MPYYLIKYALMVWSFLKRSGIDLRLVVVEMGSALATRGSLFKVAYTSNTYRLLTYIMSFVGSVNWSYVRALTNAGYYYNLTPADHTKIRELLKPDYYFILTRRSTHLSTYLISLASFLSRGKFSHYTHALLNVDSGNIRNDSDFKLVEATGTGVHYSTFLQVFDCDSVALLKPRSLTVEEWTRVLDNALQSVGKEYDNLFDVLDETRVSCVELCRGCLKDALPDYEQRFANFEAMINKYGKRLDPGMLYDCSDFEVVFEARR